MTISYYLKPLYSIGPFKISSYFLFLSIAFVVCFFVASKLAREKGINHVYIIDLLIIAIITSLCGSKLFGVIFEDFAFYRENPGRIFKIWEGGLVFYGGLMFASLSGFAYAYYRKIDFSKLADIGGITIPLGLAFGRIGCLASGCCYGKVASWGINYKIVNNIEPQVLYFHPELEGVNLIPTQPIYSLITFSIFLFLYFFRKRFEGILLPLFGIMYSVFRFVIEFYRADYRGVTFGVFSVSQLISVIIFSISLYFLVSLSKSSSM